MNKSELIKNLAETHKLTKDEASDIVTVFINCVKKALLDGGRVEIRGFGSFKVKDYQGYTGRNPKTGKEVRVAPKRLPFFKAGKELKDFLNS